MFTCAECVGANVCFNGLQHEFHLIVNTYQGIVEHKNCDLYKNDYFFICRIGTGHCEVNVTSSSDYFIVKCPIIEHKSVVMSAPVYLNTSVASCTG